jgi:beta-glucosidase
MSGYNKINGEYAGGNQHLLNEVLKGAWGYPGYVMSDWGATPDWRFALHGLDQESGLQGDTLLWGKQPFTDELKDAYATGELPSERLSDMVRRILRSLFAVGADQWGPAPEVDMAQHHQIALEGARQGIVLLKNEGGVLPIRTDEPLKVAVIGGYAQQGVVSGTGSGAVNPVGGFAGVVKIGGAGVMGRHRNLFLFPPSPVDELRKALPQAEIDFDPGYTPAEAALTAKRCDVVIFFGIRVEGEGFDSADLSLPWGQDAVIDAVAAANPNTIVVLQTGNPVTMPWRDEVKAIVQAWYPGQAGAKAIAEVLTGAVNPSGRLPVTFPESLEQTPRPDLPGLGTPWGTSVTIEYNEGAEIGYRWFAKTGATPMYAFGHGLSYTTFEYNDLDVTGGDTVTATFTVTNTGDRAGADVPQLYLTEAAGDRRQRLLGFERVQLDPGESRSVTLTADPRLLGRFDGAAGRWRITDGTYGVAVGRSAVDPDLTAKTTLNDALFGS